MAGFHGDAHVAGHKKDQMLQKNSTADSKCNTGGFSKNHTKHQHRLKQRIVQPVKKTRCNKKIAQLMKNATQVFFKKSNDTPTSPEAKDCTACSKDLTKQKNSTAD